MLESTFLFLKGIGEFTERRIWDDGTTTWDRFLRAARLPGISAGRKSLYDPEVATAQDRYQQQDARYFSRCLKSRDQWRLFKAFQSRTLFLDIETTGTAPHEGDVTMVGLYSAGRMTTLVRGESLTEERLADELDRHDLLVTFFGSVFDIPFLRAKYPRLRLDHPHFDLCFAARRLGIGGGLKQIEIQFDIARRPDIHDMDGWDAVRLWHQWQHGDDTALSRLIAYNEADVKNLEPLAHQLYEMLTARYGPSSTTRCTGSDAAKKD